MAPPAGRGFIEADDPAGGSRLSTIGRLCEGLTLPQAAAEIAAAQVHVADRPGRVVDGRVAEGSFELRPVYAARVDPAVVRLTQAAEP
jgi:hypothetical protein